MTKFNADRHPRKKQQGALGQGDNGGHFASTQRGEIIFGTDYDLWATNTVPTGTKEQPLTFHENDVPHNITSGFISVRDSNIHQKIICVEGGEISYTTIDNSPIGSSNPEQPVHIRHCNIWDSSISDASVTDTRIKNCNLLDVSIDRVTISDSSTGFKTSEDAHETRPASWTNTKITDVEASATNRFNEFHHIEATRLTARASVFHQKISNCTISDSHLERTQLTQGMSDVLALQTDFTEAIANGTHVNQLRHTGKGYGIHCIESVISNSYLAGDYRGGRFQGTTIHAGEWKGSFHDANFTGAKFIGEKSGQLPTLLTGDFTGARFHRANMSEAATGSGTIFDKSNPSQYMEYTHDTAFPPGFNPQAPEHGGRWRLVNA